MIGRSNSGDYIRIARRGLYGLAGVSQPMLALMPSPELPTPDGYEDQPYDVYTELSLNANDFLTYQAVLIGPNDGGYFHLRALLAQYTATGGYAKIGVRNADMALMQNSLTAIDSLFATDAVSAVGATYPDVIYGPGGSIFFDAQENTGLGGVSLKLCFSGIKRYPKGAAA